MQNCKTRYKKTVELNDELSPYTGSITCYDGEIRYDDGPFQEQFVEIVDCHNKVRIHRGFCQNESEYINKLIKMRNTLSEYITHLFDNFDDTNKLIEEQK